LSDLAVDDIATLPNVSINHRNSSIASRCWMASCDDDRRIFSDEALKKQIDEMGVEIISWRQLRERAQ
jgi:hypothetical protein